MIYFVCVLFANGESDEYEVRLFFAREKYCCDDDDRLTDDEDDVHI
jgi:hypothetical protein